MSNLIELTLETAIKEAGDILDVRLLKEDAAYILELLKEHRTSEKDFIEPPDIRCKELINLINDVIRVAILYGGDPGGPCFTEWFKLEEAVRKLSDVLECDYEWDSGYIHLTEKSES